MPESGRPAQGAGLVDERHVSAEYLPTLKARLVCGRLFTDAEDASRPGVTVINQVLARRYFRGQDPSDRGSPMTSRGCRTPGRLSAW
jgi:hypothetical protein